MERQYGSLDQIRPDHVKRYKFATLRIPKDSIVMDGACGCGYGSKILYDAGFDVTGVDIEPEALDYAETHYAGPEYLLSDVTKVKGKFDALVSFETIEHLPKPEQLLELNISFLICSVPNQDRYPFYPQNFEKDKYPHLRHYTPKELEKLLTDNGYKVREKWCQRDKKGDIVSGTDGMFLIYVCENI